MLQLPSTAPKAPGLADRCVPIEQTASLIPALRERFGITRIADTTYLDRTGIPTYSAVVPQSRDLISVYNGKGSTPRSALCSAVMEAVERQCAAAPDLPIFQRNSQQVQEALDLRALALLQRPSEAPLDCVVGTDLLTRTEIAVPLALVQCPWFGEKLFPYTSTNGLASGNNLTEAIYHALCELIERHVWSMYHARSHLLPRVFFSDGSDFGFAREIVFPTGNEEVDALARSIAHSGLTLRGLYLPEDSLPATMVATLAEPGASPPMTHMGFGASLDPIHALRRAITEAVQSRVVDIQGAREDVVRSDAPRSQMADHARRQTTVPNGRWYFDAPCETIELECIPNLARDDLALDLQRVLQGLEDIGIGRLVVVDLSPPELPVCVVRVIAPELETTILDGRIGRRIRNLLNPFKFDPRSVQAHQR